MPKNSDDKLELATIHEFERVQGQLKAFQDEISTLSKKNPDGAMNKFKLRFINETLKKATVLLGNVYRPFPEFEVFVEDEMPTASDVGMMLSQYLTSMDRFRKAHVWREGVDVYWHTISGGRIRADGRID